MDIESTLGHTTMISMYYQCDQYNYGKALNLVVVGSSPTVGVSACIQWCALCSCTSLMCMQLPLEHHRDHWYYMFPYSEE